MKLIKPYDGLSLFESETFGGLRVYDGISPTIRAEKVQAGVFIVGSICYENGENGRGKESAERVRSTQSASRL